MSCANRGSDFYTLRYHVPNHEFKNVLVIWTYFVLGSIQGYCNYLKQIRTNLYCICTYCGSKILCQYFEYEELATVCKVKGYANRIYAEERKVHLKSEIVQGLCDYEKMLKRFLIEQNQLIFWETE